MHACISEGAASTLPRTCSTLSLPRSRQRGRVSLEAGRKAPREGKGRRESRYHSLAFSFCECDEGERGECLRGSLSPYTAPSLTLLRLASLTCCKRPACGWGLRS